MTATKRTRPGGPIASRPLHFIWLADCSGSMAYDGKIQALNAAVREALPHMRAVAAQNTNATVLVRAVRFSTGAEWHVRRPVPVESFSWRDLQAQGLTDLGAGLRLVTAELQVPPMPERALAPVLVLVSDGCPTDDYEPALRDLLATPWGGRAVRLAVGIGRDADREVLGEFMSTDGAEPLRANSPESLVRHIRWASTIALDAVAAARGAGPDAAHPSAPRALVPIPEDSGDGGRDDVW